MPPGSPTEAPGAFLSVTGCQGSSPPAKATCVTLTSPIPRHQEQLPDCIVPDGKWPGMYRIHLPDGSLSDMVNVTRAKDAAKAH